MTLTNHEQKPLTIPEMPVQHYSPRMPPPPNPLRVCNGLSFALRFENGKLVEVPNAWVSYGIPVEWKPLQIEGEASFKCGIEFGFLFGGGHAADALRECSGFSLTAIVKDLGLKSNTLYFNGFKEPKEKPDALKDAEAYRKWAKEKQEEEWRWGEYSSRELMEAAKRGEDIGRVKLRLEAEFKKKRESAKPRP